MSTIPELGLSEGDSVRVTARPHTYNKLGHRPPEEIFTFEIVGINKDGSPTVYLHPWTERLVAFTRVQNPETGEIDARRPLRPSERLVLAMNGNADCYSRAEPKPTS